MKIYPDPAPFLSRARNHMRQWVSRELGVEPTDPVSVLIPASRAEAGRNFYERHNVIGAVKERFPHAFRAKASRGSRVGDALCSAHAPFNLFAPLRSDLSSGAAASVLSAMLAANVDHVHSIAFEQPASRNQSPLGDNTAFDSLISATASGRPLRVGVEVKFTERPYGWGESEKKRMFDSGGLYNVATQSGERFQPNAAVQLRNCHLKQLWRNMLLAQELSTTLNAPFYYVHLFPEGNVYQAAVVARFARTLTEHGAALFRPVTYEKYFEILGLAGCDSDWVSYLRRRYLVLAR